MDENLSRGYVQLGKVSRAATDFRFTNGFSHLSPPVDKYYKVYYSMVLAGIGFLLPYNSFIIAVDYFQAQYPGSTIVFDMSLVYIIMAFFAVLANNILVETLPLNTRITFGYFVSFITLLFVATCEIWWGAFSKSTSYTLNLVAVAAVALGCTVQQSSFYGYTSMLPSRYTQAVMAGESGAGLVVSINRVVTKMMSGDQRLNTTVFFVCSFLIIGGCFLLHQLIRQTDFVQFYLTLCRESKRITLEPTEDVSLMEGGGGGAGSVATEGCDSAAAGRGYGVLKLQATSPIDTHLSFANPVYEPSSHTTQGPTYKVEDVILRSSSQVPPSYPQTSRREKLCAAISRGVRTRWTVAKSIWQYMLSISVAYFVTLCLYPGVMSEIVSCKFGSWMPVILMTAFNTSDLMGKMVASIPYEWSKTQLLFCSILRSILIPLTLLTAAPRGSPAVQGEGYPLLFSMLLGLTNGVVGSIPMIQAPSRVSDDNRELSGNIMTLSYNVGLTGGSLMAYALDWLVGPPVSENPCNSAVTILPTYDSLNSTSVTTLVGVTAAAAAAAAAGDLVVSTFRATLASAPTTPHPFSNLTLINSTLTLH